MRVAASTLPSHSIGCNGRRAGSLATPNAGVGSRLDGGLWDFRRLSGTPFPEVVTLGENDRS